MGIKSVIFICVFFLFFNLNAQDINGTYAIKNVETNLVLRIKDARSENGTPLVAYTPVNWKCVTWKFKKVEEQTYQLKNLFTGKTFQVKGKEPISNISLEQQPLSNNNKNQYYQFIPAGNDSYYIKLLETELYLTPESPEGGVNSAIVLKNKVDDQDIQKWVIYEQKPTM